MRIKEVRISKKGYEVTLSWTVEEITSKQGVPIVDQLKPHIDFLELIERELKEARAKHIKLPTDKPSSFLGE